MTDQPVGDLIKSITEDVKQLVRDEVALAKAELIPAAKNGGMGAGLFAGAGYFAISALSVLYLAAGFGLASSSAGTSGSACWSSPSPCSWSPASAAGSATCWSRRWSRRRGPSPRPTGR